jgi:hypothetical protein
MMSRENREDFHRKFREGKESVDYVRQTRPGCGLCKADSTWVRIFRPTNELPDETRHVTPFTQPTTASTVEMVHGATAVMLGGASHVNIEESDLDT